MDDRLAWAMLCLALILLVLVLVLLWAVARAQQQCKEQFRQQRDRTRHGASSLHLPQERGWMGPGRLNGSILRRTELEREE